MSYYFYWAQPQLQENQNQSVGPQDPGCVMGPSFQTQTYFIPSNYSVSAPSISYSEFPCVFSQPDLPVPESRPETEPKEQRRKRQRNCEKQIESAKKNSESNLINHFFSFFASREKSERIVESCIKSLVETDSHKEKLMHLLYNAIHVLNHRRGRGYVNRKYLLDLFEQGQLEKTVPEIKEKVGKVNLITMEQLCKVFRKCCFNFFRTYSIDSILTSKRISCIAKEEHFRKRRRILRSFFFQD